MSLRLYFKLGFVVNLNKSAPVAYSAVASSRIDHWHALRILVYPPPARVGTLVNTMQGLLSQIKVSGRFMWVMGLMASSSALVPLCKFQLYPSLIHLMDHFSMRSDQLTKLIPIHYLALHAFSGMVKCPTRPIVANHELLGAIDPHLPPTRGCSWPVNVYRGHTELIRSSASVSDCFALPLGSSACGKTGEGSNLIT